MVEEYFEIHKPKPKSNPRNAVVQWSPPSERLYKVNFDAALFDHLGCAGLGVVVRDWRGNVLAALSQKVALPQSVEMAEALAAKRAVQLATEMSFTRVLVEGDCKRVVQALQTLGRCLKMYGHLIADARRLGATLQTCTFHHTLREGNLLAHSLARRAVLTADTVVWVKELPSDLNDEFQNDLSFI
nr:uncharacterized protein LOC112019310 [Quercus suber]